MTNAEQKKQVEAPVRFPWLESFLEGWSIFKQNLLGKIGLSLLVMFALMALFSYLPPPHKPHV